ncbi:MAG: prolyl oligopeptidase family serine peptidase [Gemmatimonadota bacterium]|nr:prolyl oligopeptidase family serine peptidase [Gemmatimonadota bacterium]
MRLAPLLLALTLSTSALHAQGGFTIQQVKSYPFPNELTAAARGGRIAWALNEQGKRNIWVADAPDYKARRLTNYLLDDGQELTSVSLGSDGKFVVYVRGGDHGSNWAGASPNPMSMPNAPKIELWTVPFAGGAPKRIAEGDDPVISPRGDVVVFIKDRAIWTSPLDGSGTAKKLFSANGEAEDPQWSPDGSRLAFVSGRGDHAMIGIYTNDTTAITWVAPSTKTDRSPRWSLDGSRIAFVRTASGGAPDSVLADVPRPWAIWSADTRSGVARELWKSPVTLRGSIANTQGGTNLQYGAGRIAFLTELDGWPHLYSIGENGGPATLLTPGKFMAEYVTMSQDGHWLAFAGNAGSDADDVDRRHIVRVPIDRAAPEVLTPGTGLEWTPAFTGDGGSVAFIGATAQRPPLPAVLSARAPSDIRWIGAEQIPADFPTAQLVTPKKVVFRSADGLEIHGQLFESANAGLARDTKKPAILYVHGGPPRQMLLGWNYSDYYANAYASNQYLASRGFVVLSVNYRLGIGYGREFQHPKNAGNRGASEYLDVLAGAKYLQSMPQVDRTRIGIYGGSYGGFLTALALGRNSDIFATGVDIHGVHDWTAERAASLLAPRYEKPADIQRALDIAWKSSPVSSVGTWRSPVLLIHADDDRNVRFNQTVSLARRLEKKGVTMEEIVIPDDTHHMMRHANWVRVDSATAAWFERKFGRTVSRAP